jgi:hypothetical protein
MSQPVVFAECITVLQLASAAPKPAEAHQQQVGLRRNALASINAAVAGHVTCLILA